MNKWYIHNQASVLENDTHNLLWDFDIWDFDHLISVRRPDLIIINKKKENLQKSWWTSGDHPNDSIVENSQNTEKSPED